MYSFCSVLSIKHTANLHPSYAKWDFYLLFPTRLIASSCFKTVFTINSVQILLKTLLYRDEGLKEPESSRVDFGKISCLKTIKEITFKKTTADLKTKLVREQRKKRGILKAVVIAEGLISV